MIFHLGLLNKLNQVKVALSAHAFRWLVFELVKKAATKKRGVSEGVAHLSCRVHFSTIEDTGDYLT